MGVHYTSGSLTTFEGIYPTFRLFEIDEETMLPVQIHTYKMNPESETWDLDHTIPEFYDLPDLSPASIEQMAHRIFEGDLDLALRFQNTKSNGGSALTIDSCQIKCRVDLFCQILNSVYSDSKLCQNQQKVDIFFDHKHAIPELLISPWYTKL